MLLILSGVSGSGKTSACAIVARKASEAGAIINGVICGAVFEGGRKIGIDWTDLARGPNAEPRLLARAKPGMIATDTGRVIRYGMWEFDRAALAAADESASKSVVGLAGSDELPGIVIVDEIGPLELDRGVGMVRTLAALDEAARKPGTRKACIIAARPDIAKRLSSRWPGSIVLEVAGQTAERVADDALASCRSAIRNTIGNTTGI